MQTIAQANTLTYTVDGLRSLMLVNPPKTVDVSVDFIVLIVVTAVLIFIGSPNLPQDVPVF